MSSWTNSSYFILNVDICFKPLIVLKFLESHYYFVEIRENNLKQSYVFIIHTYFKKLGRCENWFPAITYLFLNLNSECSFWVFTRII